MQAVRRHRDRGRHQREPVHLVGLRGLHPVQHQILQRVFRHQAADALRGAAQRIGGLVAENALENLVLYRMKPAQADEMDRLALVASPITVTPHGLHMSVSPRQN